MAKWNGIRWSLAALFVCLVICSALVFMQYLGEAAYYSGNLGRISDAEAQAVGESAVRYYKYFLMLEAITVLIAAAFLEFWKEYSDFWQGAVVIVARLVVGLVLSLAATAAVVLTLTGVGYLLYSYAG